MAKRVLFFMNSLNRTGSETLLFHLIHDLYKTQQVAIGIVLMEKGGELVPEIPEEIPVFYLNFQFSWKDKLAHHLGFDVIGKQLQEIQIAFKADVWYHNTISHLDLLRYKKQYNVQSFVHVHELLYNFESLKTEEFQLLIDECDHLIACSSLVENIFRPYLEKKITVINSTIDQQVLEKFIINRANSNSKKIKIASAGTICYRKGTDLFLEIANLMDENKYEFIWLGKFANNAFSEVIKSKNEVQKRVKFISTTLQDEYFKQLAQADVFLSTSREESMGLVMMEAASLKVPIVALASGGSSLIVNANNGIVCYDNRPEQLVKAIEEVLSTKSSSNKPVELAFSYAKECQKFVSLFTS